MKPSFSSWEFVIRDFTPVLQTVATVLGAIFGVEYTIRETNERETTMKRDEALALAKALLIELETWWTDFRSVNENPLASASSDIGFDRWIDLSLTQFPIYAANCGAIGNLEPPILGERIVKCPAAIASLVSLVIKNNEINKKCTSGDGKYGTHLNERKEMLPVLRTGFAKGTEVIDDTIGLFKSPERESR
jgi:hypothetical protein